MRPANLQQLRKWRTRPDRDLSIAGPVREAAAQAQQRHDAGQGAGQAWDELVPPRLRRRCTVLQLQRGILTVRIPDAAARFELDRWLRSGGEAALARRGVKRVKSVP